MEKRVFEALDLVQCEIEQRFDQSGMATASSWEETLLAAAKGSIASEADMTSLQLPGNTDVAHFHMQLRMLGDLIKKEDFNTLHKLWLYMSNLHFQTRVLFKDVENLIRLCLCLPISVALSERSFSALRRLKTWLRNTVTQKWDRTHTTGLVAYTSGHSEHTGYPCFHDRVYLNHPWMQNYLRCSTIYLR